jgi:hypothetical protein
MRTAIILSFVLASCGKIHFEPNNEVIDLKTNPGFWDKSEACNLDSLFNESKVQHKPVLLYFTGYACVNNRKMEDNLFIYKDIYDLMRERFVPRALYVDDYNTKISEPYTSNNGREIKTIGDQNGDIQQTLFSRNAQPHIVILRSDRSLVSEISYTKSRSEFKKFLTDALGNWDK